MTKTTFFSFIFPILLSFTSRPSLIIVLCANQKLERKTCNTRVILFWTISDAIFEMSGNLSFARRNVVNFIAEIYIFPFIDCVLLIIQCILSSEWSWNSFWSSVCSCPQHVVEWPCGQVGPKQLLCCQEEIALIQWWFRVIVENSWAQRVEAIDLFFIQK